MFKAQAQAMRKAQAQATITGENRRQSQARTGDNHRRAQAITGAGASEY